MSKQVTAPSVNNSSTVQIEDRVKRVNIELYFKLENLYKATQNLFTILYDEVEKIEDKKLNQSIFEMIMQIDTLLKVQHENLTYHDFEAVEELIYNLTHKDY